MVALAATPRDVVAKLSADIVAALKLPDVSEKLAAQGAEIAGTTPEALPSSSDASSPWSEAGGERDGAVGAPINGAHR